MKKYQARFKTAFGEMVVSFDTKNELEEAIKDFDTLVDTISQHVKLPLPEQIQATAFEDLHTLSAEGVPRLLKHPAIKGDAVRLALFLAPRPLTLNQLTEASGVANPLAYVNKKELIKASDGRYSLESSARTSVLEKVIPSVRKVKTSGE
jgi:hypothetical protein